MTQLFLMWQWAGASFRQHLSTDVVGKVSCELVSTLSPLGYTSVAINLIMKVSSGWCSALGVPLLMYACIV